MTAPGETHPLLDAGPGLPAPDRWPGLQLDYRYAGAPATGQRHLLLGLGFATDADAAQAARDAVPWQAIVRQLADAGTRWSLRCTLDGGVAHALDIAPLRTLADAALAWCQVRAAGGAASAPTPQTITVAIEPANPQDLFELVVDLVLQLPPAAPGGPPQDVACRIAPAHGPVVRGRAQALAGFAADLEAATDEPSCLLKLARGVGAADADGLPPLWLLRLCRQPAAPQPRGLHWTAGAACCSAPPPLTRGSLDDGTVAVPGFDAALGVLWTTTAPQVVAGVGLDDWAQDALAALDSLLQTPTRERLAQLDGCVAPAPATPVVPALDALRDDLADAVAATLQPILAGDRPDGAMRAEAQALARRLLGGEAAQACRLGALVQIPLQLTGRLDATTAGPDTGTARLLGRIAAAGSEGDWATAQLPLHAGASVLSTAFTPHAPAARAQVQVAPRFLPDAVEWTVADPARPGQTVVRRLALLRPLDDAVAGLALGEAEVPLPLRTLPPQPVLVSQGAAPATWPDDAVAAPGTAGAAAAASSIVKAATSWTAIVTFGAPQAAQDLLGLTLTGTADAPSGTRRSLPAGLGAADDLFSVLARCHALWPGLAPALDAALAAWWASPDDEATTVRAQVLAADALRLLAPLAPAWRAWPAAGSARARSLAPPPGPDPAPRFSLTLQEQAGDDGALRPVITAAAPAAGDWAPGTAPTLVLEVPDDAAAVTWRASGADAAAPGRYRQGDAVLDAATARGLPHRQARFGGLALTHCTSVWSTATVTRNAVLLRDAQGRPRPTAPAFVSTLPPVVFPGVIRPLLQHDRVLDLAALSTPRRQPLATHFAAWLTLLLDGLPADGLACLQLALSLQVAQVDGLPAVRLPILLLTGAEVVLQPRAEHAPGQPLPVTPATLADGLAAGVQRWWATQPPATGSVLCLSLTWSRPPEPLLAWDGLQLACADIADLPAAGG